MLPTDPLHRFSVECASAVFAYLSASDLAHCERVSRGWRTFTRQWMASFGLRLHYPHEVDRLGTLKADTAITRFKSYAALRANIRRGRPSIVCKYERTRAFLAAGDFCVWLKHNEGIFWQHMSYQGGVFPQPASLLDPADAFHSYLDPTELMVLGANGYLLIRYPADSPPGTVTKNYRDTLYCLKTGKQMWTRHYQRESYDVPFFTPLLVGEDRVYFGRVTTGRGGSSEIHAYALHSGELLYRADTVAHSSSYCGFLDTRPHPYGIPLQLVRGAEDELILVCKPHSQTERLVTIHLINGTNGNLHQKMLVDVLTSPYILVSASKSAFTLISHERYTSTVRIQTFSRQTNGQFAEIRIETVDLPSPHDFRHLALDPFSQAMVALREEGTVPCCSSLEDACDDSLLSSRKAAFKPFFSPKRLDRCLVTSAVSEVALPPRSEGAKSLDSLPPGSGLNREGLSVVDGHRFTVNGERHESLDIWTVYLLDFNPRARV
ncbi:hypothetical protein BDV12DRAFT_29683 [Aspergillus spectabilis]